MGDKVIQSLTAEKLLHLLAEELRDYAIIPLGREGGVQAYNRSVARIFGYEESAIIGQAMSMLYPTPQRTADRLTELLEVVARRGRFEESTELQRANGQSFPAHLVVVGLPEAAGYFALIRDLTAAKGNFSQLHALATVDQLTGLTNRQHMFDLGRVEYRRWKRYGVPLSLLLVDIDAFSNLNAQYGQSVGDSILRYLANLLRATARDVDSVARIESDLFALMLVNTPVEGAVALAERIRTSLQGSPLRAQGLNLQVTLSQAAAAANSRTIDFEQSFDGIEQRLKIAKAAGPDRIDVL